MQWMSNSLQLNKALLKAVLSQAKTIVDATCGNGNDTFFLAQNMASDAHIYAFDIQEVAIENTKELTREYSDRITYICDSHQNFAQYIADKIDIVVFNLGYLPKGNHALTTTAEVTLPTLKSFLEHLQVQGHISLAVYSGHPAGLEEENELYAYAKKLDKRRFTVGWYKLVNHPQAPSLCWIEKQK